MTVILYFVKKCLTSLIVPPGLFLLFLFSFVFSLKGKKRVSGILLIALFWIFSTPFVGMSLMDLKENHPFIYPEVKNYSLKWKELEKSKVPIDAILLLGGGMVKGSANGKWGSEGRPSDVMVVRSVEAKRVYDLIKAKLVITGGRPPFQEHTSEAVLTQHLLLDLGVPEHKMILEENSRDTDDNARLVAKIVQEQGWKNILLLTSAFHMERSYGLFRHALPKEVKIWTYPVNNYVGSKGFSFDKADILDFFPHDFFLVKLLTREYLGLFFYLIKDGKPSP